MSDYLHADWEKKAKANQKKYKQLLAKTPVREGMKKLPDLHEEAFEKIDCLDCGACCKNYSPRFKTPDIKRISKVLKMRESDFIHQYLRVDEDGDFVVKSSPCPFLQDDNACRIYEDRPSDCRRFPYTEEDVFFKRPQLTLKNATFCPITFFVLEKMMDQK